MKHISNIMSLISMLYSYSLQPVLINQCLLRMNESELLNFNTVDSLILKISCKLWTSEKTINC